ncbi:MAG: SRPBCC family protein [Armatimonadota bacterium]
MNHERTQIDPERDLVLERVVTTSRADIYAAWTTPGLIVQWFAPKPWSTTFAEIDLRPGGASKFTMASPDGQEFPNVGCILECVPNERLVFTDAMEAGFRPSVTPFFTGIIELEDVEGGTLYRAIAKHKNAEDRKKHEDMGFITGWGQCLDQLVELMAK